MIEVHFLIPIHGNDKKAFSRSRKRAFQETLERLFNGYTGPLEPVEGGWRDGSGKSYRDVNRAYVVLVDGLIAAASRILEAVEFAKANFDQLAITVLYLAHAEIL